MWSTFYHQDEERGTAGPGIQGGAKAAMAGGFGAGGVRGHKGHKRRAHVSTSSTTAGGTDEGGMSDRQESKIKLAFFVAIVGIVLSVLGVGTEFWVELAPPKSLSVNNTCLVAHYGLWKSCTKAVWVADVDPERESCGPADMPGGSRPTKSSACIIIVECTMSK